MKPEKGVDRETGKEGGEMEWGQEWGREKGEEKKAVLRIRIRIHMFLGLLDPDPNPIVKGMDPDPSIISKKIGRKTLISTVLGLFFDFLSLKNYVNVPSKSNIQKNFIKKINFLLAF
jgi:hypothetical protein